MRHTLGTILLLALLATPPAAASEAGTVVAIDGDSYTVTLGDADAVSVGSELQVYRRLPSARGTAAYREVPLWWEVGTLTVQAVGGGLAVATWSAPPAEPVPEALDESGAPSDQVQVGDRIRPTGAVAGRPGRVRVSFDLRDLYAPGEVTMQGEGAAYLGRWLRGVRSIQGPVVVEVHARMEELGEEAPDLSREMSLEVDAPFGPAPGEPTVPVEDLYEAAPQPARVPSAREVLVVDGARGRPDVWRYLDPVSLAHRQGARVADALAAGLELDRSSILVRVVPRPTSAHDLAVRTPGYDAPRDQLRVLVSAIDWAEPPPTPRARPPKQEEEEPVSEPPPHRRRLLERPPPPEDNT